MHWSVTGLYIHPTKSVTGEILDVVNGGWSFQHESSHFIKLTTNDVQHDMKAADKHRGTQAIITGLKHCNRSTSRSAHKPDLEKHRMEIAGWDPTPLYASFQLCTDTLHNISSQTTLYAGSR